MSDWASKRFWKNTAVAAVDCGFTIHLDGRGVKTPAKRTLVVPTENLAEAIAAEWDAQEDMVDPLTMPMTRSANAAIDKVAIQKDEVADLIAAYGENDLLCYRADGPRELIERQAAIWDPLLDWAATALDARLSTTQGIMHAEQPENSIAALRAAVFDQDNFGLTALHDLVSISGSLVIGLAAQKNAFDLGDLWQASRLDELWQIEQWGDDEEATEAAHKKESAFVHAHEFFVQTLN